MMMKLMYFLKTLHDKYSLLEYMYDVCIHKMCNMPLWRVNEHMQKLQHW